MFERSCSFRDTSLPSGHARSVVCKAAARTARVGRSVGPPAIFPLDDACVDAIFSVNTVFYLDDPLTVFQELRRVLRESGSLMFCFTARESMEQKQIAAHGLTLYAPEEVSVLLKLAGFSTVDVTRHRDRSRFF